MVDLNSPNRAASPTPGSRMPARRSRSASGRGLARSVPVSASDSSSARRSSPAPVARQPEMKDELQAIRWLGFALTEAVAFYTFIFGLIAFFL